MARRWKNPFADTKPTTVGLGLLVAAWGWFQWKDPTPPPVLDQLLVATFGVWFAQEAIDKKNDVANKKKKSQADAADGDDADEEEGEEEAP